MEKYVCPDPACLITIQHIDERITELEHEIGGNGKPGIRHDVHDLRNMADVHGAGLSRMEKDIEWIKRLVFVAMGYALAADLGIIELVKGLGG